MKPKPRAFTLVEVLLAAALVAMVGMAIFQAFANGLKLWTKAQRLNREAEVAIFLDRMEQDLRSTPLISGISFKGIATQISFPAVVMTRADRKSSMASEVFIDQIGAVQYRFDALEHTIFRRQTNYAQALKGQWGQELPVVGGIDEFNFYYEVASDKGFLMKPQSDEVIPSGVMVKMHFSDDSGEHHLRRYFRIPVGG
ncbi:MAG: type II secretion system protein [Candidatus Omnitrophica bacterium]|nr:type II secretion system protein [Candidatus Omnitrophota bacterium]